LAIRVGFKNPTISLGQSTQRNPAPLAGHRESVLGGCSNSCVHIVFQPQPSDPLHWPFQYTWLSRALFQNSLPSLYMRSRGHKSPPLNVVRGSFLNGLVRACFSKIPAPALPPPPHVSDPSLLQVPSSFHPPAATHCCHLGHKLSTREVGVLVEDFFFLLSFRVMHDIPKSFIPHPDFPSYYLFPPPNQHFPLYLCGTS